MRRHPNISLVKYLSIRNLKAFSMCIHEEINGDRETLNTLQLVAENSESVELLRIILEIDQSMSKKTASGFVQHALGPLCRRSASQFSTFYGMLECLLTANSDSEIVSDALACCFMSYAELNSIDINALIKVTELLLEVIGNAYDTRSFRAACYYLKGELCIAVLSLFLTKYNEKAGLRVRDGLGQLPIHIAARHSTFDVVDFLLKAYPESIYEITALMDTIYFIWDYNCLTILPIKRRI